MIYRMHAASSGRALLSAATLAFAVALLASCAPDIAEEPATPPAIQPPPAAETPAPPGEPAEEPAASAFPWLDVELEDVQTGERFSIADFRGQPVLVKSFAVW